MAVQGSTRRRMGLKLFAAAALTLCLFSCISAPDAPEQATQEELEPLTPDEAKNIFILHCESCHGLDGKKQSADAADLSASTLPDAKVREMILNGNDKGMMPYKDVITSQRDLDGVIEYVKSLREKK